jgi:hypothetical protein
VFGITLGGDMMAGVSIVIGMNGWLVVFFLSRILPISSWALVSARVCPSATLVGSRIDASLITW